MLKQVFHRNSDKRVKPGPKLPPLANLPPSSLSSTEGSATSDCSRTPSRSSHSDRPIPPQQPLPSPTTSSQGDALTALFSHDLSLSSPAIIKPLGKALNNNTNDGADALSTKGADVLDYSAQWHPTALYIEYDDGVLCKNAQPFVDVVHCFVCDIDVGTLTPSVELTGAKSHRGVAVPVYRQIFRCAQCIANHVAAAQQQELCDQLHKVVISREAQLRYFSRSG